MQTSVTPETWKQKMDNLMNRRRTGYRWQPPSKASDYASHFEKCKLGMTVLDVGCGDTFVKEYCPGEYVGIDAYPIRDGVINAQIESFESEKTFETIVAFQVLDGLQDLVKAITNMKRLCDRNIILLTGLNIEPDEFHTLKIMNEILNTLMESGKKFVQTFSEELSPKIFLIEYSLQNEDGVLG